MFDLHTCLSHAARRCLLVKSWFRFVTSAERK